MRCMQLHDTCLKTSNNIPQFNENCFDVIRLIAAIIVVLSHSFRWFELEKPAYMLFFTDGSVGVIVLYALSGYLTYASYDRIVKNGGNAGLFWYKRAVRIYPLYLLISVIMVLLDAINGAQVLTGVYIVRRLLNIATFGLVYVPGGMINGVIWSLRVEVVYYLLLPIIYRILNNKRLLWWLTAVVILWQFNVWDEKIIGFLFKLPFGYLISRIDNPMFFIYEFLIGSMFFCHREKLLGVFSRKSVIVPMTAAFTMWAFIYQHTEWIAGFGQMHNPIYGIMLPFITLGLGYAFGSLRLKFDISYAMFLVHMPIISQLLKSGASGPGWMLVAWLMIAACSFALHYMYERPVRRYTQRLEKRLETAKNI